MEPAPPPEFRSADMAAQQSGGPNINVSSAPGVAFNYRYAFRLPNSRISAAQEAHAAMCEKLGVTRCRITGMRYSVVNERDVSASRIEARPDDRTNVRQGCDESHHRCRRDAGRSGNQRRRRRLIDRTCEPRTSRAAGRTRPGEPRTIAPWSFERGVRPPAFGGGFAALADPLSGRAEGRRRRLAREDADGFLLRVRQGDPRLR